MTSNQQTGNRKKPGPLTRASLWFQRRTNVKTNEKIRRKGGKIMGMDLLILHTVGRRSGQRRESPVTWFDGGDGTRLIVASGGGSRHPDWYFNLVAHPDKTAIEIPGESAVPATPQALEGAEREQAWQRITEAQPRYAKYQKKSDRRYPVIRLTPR
ncbi:nitroreductase family deazaflavin-dependent oxidoreductase [Prauserella flavalba]|uniref:Nitroreductase n=1 Tax=Prauserella flavalba TaxID=1477506 RepID=A0A318LVN5_9PSEU|nr:nitroreductase family deazaflavin-dependent oxidoreductase [Prauserella flavalba]PXY36418.1 nitroreductase [Prauserella flavalba]